MVTEIDVKTELQSGWVIRILKSGSIDYTGLDRPEYRYRVGELAKTVDVRFHQKKLIGAEFENVYGVQIENESKLVEYRFQKIQIADIDWVTTTGDRDVTFIADVVAPWFPATPFDGFLIGIEQGDLNSAGMLLDYLEELDDHTIPIRNLRMFYRHGKLNYVSDYIYTRFGGSRRAP